MREGKRSVNKVFGDRPNCDDENGYVYIFNMGDQTTESCSAKLKNKIWQIFPSFCASLTCVSFGLMLGWPCAMYPRLLKPTSEIPITLDQSAMIAGFLMIGNTVGTPFSSTWHLGPKYGIIIGSALMTVGWILMWQARDIYWLLGSRFLIGLGNGYGFGQLKNYIKEMTEDNLTTCLIKQISLFIIFGTILAFIIGTFLDFRKFSMFSLIMSIFILFICIFLPSTPKDLIRNGNIKDAHRLIKFLGPHLNPRSEVANIRDQMENVSCQMPFVTVFKDEELKKNFVKLSVILFGQQFSGIPATFVYAQILLEVAKTPYHTYCAMVYIFIFFLISACGVYFPLNVNKKYMLMFSSFGTSLILAVIILILYFKVNTIFWSYTFFMLLIFYMLLHTIGLGTVTLALIPDYFPENLQIKIIYYYIMVHSILALIITKTFQVLMGEYDLYVPFCLFLAVSSMTCLFIIFAVPKRVSERNTVNFNVHVINEI